MINLTTKEMPNGIYNNGVFYELNTDFRLWIKFSELIKDEESLEYTDLKFLFKNKVPLNEFYYDLKSFFYSPSLTPSNEFSTPETHPTIDYIQDGEYIWASVLHQYGIDLMEVDMHWHKFLALIRCLSDDTKYASILGIRTWTKDNKKAEQKMQQLKAMWQLPMNAKDKEAILKEQDELFYNS